MSIPASSKTTIDNLPASVSQQYARNDLAIKESPFSNDISRVSGQTSPQIAVLQPSQESQLENLTGVLGKKSPLATYERPQAELNSNIFSYAVFPQLTSKDTPLILDNLANLKQKDDKAPVEPVQQAVKLLAQLNKMAGDVFTNCRILKRG